MRPRKIIAMVMTFLMMLSLLPPLVFAAAAPEGELGGQLKIKGTAAVGSELSADYEKVTPEGLTDDYVTFSWSRKVGDQLTEVGTEKTYKLVDEDLGNKIELKITGKAEMGITGELKVQLKLWLHRKKLRKRQQSFQRESRRLHRQRKPLFRRSQQRIHLRKVPRQMRTHSRLRM